VLRSPPTSRCSRPGIMPTAEPMAEAGPTQLGTFIATIFEELDRGATAFHIVACDAVRSFRMSDHAGRHPGRVMDVGVTEAAAVAIAYGLWRTGVKVFVTGFANFLALRALEPIRSLVAYHDADVTLLGAMAGLTAARDGFMHHCTEDAALLSAIPGLAVLAPSDEASTRALARRCLAEPGPRYIRLVRRPVRMRAAIQPDHDGWQPLRWRGESEGEVALCASGATAEHACAAATILDREHGVRAAVLEVGQIAPFPADAVRKRLAGFECVATCEEHQPTGGLGDATQTALSGSGVPLLRLDLAGTYPGSGSYRELLRASGLAPDQIARRVAGFLGR
jgi:transketolase